MLINSRLNLELEAFIKLEDGIFTVVCAFRFEEWVDGVHLNVSIYENTECLCFWIVWCWNSANCEDDVQSVLFFNRTFWSDFSDFRLLILMLCLVLCWTARLLKIKFYTCVVVFSFYSLFNWSVMHYGLFTRKCAGIINNNCLIGKLNENCLYHFNYCLYISNYSSFMPKKYISGKLI